MKITITTLAFLTFIPAFSQNVTLDGSFGDQGIAYVENTSEISKIILNPDGTIISAGYTIIPATGGYHITLTKHLADGTLETGFGSNGKTDTDIATSDITLDLKLQPDGKILLAGSTYLGSGSNSYHAFVVRYHPNGIIDSSFATNGIFTQTGFNDSQYTSIIVQGDGSLLLTGNADNIVNLTRLTPAGVPDSTFGTNGIRNISDVSTYFFFNSGSIRLNDGTILCYGIDATMISNSSLGCAKIDSLGNFIPSFGQGGKASFNLNPAPNVTEILSKAQELPDGSILLGGNISSDKVILKLHPDGTLDSTYATNGVVYHSLPFTELIALPDGKVLIGGITEISQNNYGMSVSRFKSDGTIDQSFGGTGTSEFDLSDGSDILNSMALADPGHLLVAGSIRIFNPTANFVLAQIDISQTLHLTENEAGDISLYPNPFSSELHIAIENQSVTAIQLTDASGRVIRQYPVNNPTTTLFLGDLASGMYQVVFVQNQGGQISRKLIKE